MNRESLRKWLLEHHETEKECWAVVKRGKPSAGALWYPDAVEEALCFGWIDSTLRKLSTGETIQRLMPRSKSSHWTEQNKARLRRMDLLGKMTDAGWNAAPTPAPFVIDQDILSELRSDTDAWEGILHFPALYRRIRIDNIQSYRSDKKLFHERLEKLIETSKAGQRYGQWDDYGRLTNYAHDYFLKTRRIGFSFWSEIDLKEARLLWGTPEVTRYICASGIFTPEEIEARLLREINEQMQSGVQYWPIYKLDDGGPIGCCGLRPHGENEYELGFHLHPEYWHQGYASEAAGAVIEYAFTTLHAKSLFAGHNPNNLASKNVLLKLGFQYTSDEYYEPTGLYHPSYCLNLN